MNIKIWNIIEKKNTLRNICKMAMQNRIILKVYKNVKNGIKYFSSNNTSASYDLIQFYS